MIFVNTRLKPHKLFFLFLTVIWQYWSIVVFCIEFDRFAILIDDFRFSFFSKYSV